MKFYHGTGYEKAKNIIEQGQYVTGFNDNSWSSCGDEGGLFVSNIMEYVECYGTCIIEIEVDEAEVLWIQDCPIDENDFGWQPEFADAAEYLIPEGIHFQARFL